MRIKFGSKSFKINLDTIMLWLTLILINRIFHFDAATTTQLRMIFGVIVFVYLIYKDKIFSGNKIIYPILYIVTIFISGIINFGFTTKLFGTLITMITTYDIIAMGIYYSKKRGFDELIKTLKCYFACILIIDDISVLINFKNLMINGQESVLYFTGSKFSVAYIHMIFMFLSMIDIRNASKMKLKRKVFFIIITIYSIFICSVVDCSTGIVGCSILFLLIYFSGLLKKVIFSNKVFIILILIVNLIFINSDLILNSSIFKTIITYLGEDLTLTGRIQIYSQLFVIVKEKLLFGYGYASQVVKEVVGYGNAQNGLIHLIIQYGLVGGMSFIMMCNYIYGKMKQRKDEIIMPALAYILSMICCSYVEICFDYNFILAISILYAYNMYKNMKEEKNE